MLERAALAQGVMVLVLAYLDLEEVGGQGKVWNHLDGQGDVKRVEVTSLHPVHPSSILPSALDDQSNCEQTIYKIKAQIKDNLYKNFLYTI